MRYLALLLTAIGLYSAALAAPNFPALTGRVVDDAHVLSPATVQSLESNLAAHEAATSNQIVVVTVPSLNGEPIEQYGYQLGRHWGIGQKGKNNGVLLIVAPHERKVRIEVGYGLEGTLTDAVGSQIIQTVILPEFRAGHMQSGITSGVSAIESVLTGHAVEPSPSAQVSSGGHPSSGDVGLVGLFVILFLLFLFSQVVLFVLYVIGSIIAFFLSLLGFHGLRNYLNRMKTRILPADKAFLLWLMMPSPRITGSGGGGFSGGGGGFGGGGSSGSW